MRVLTAEQMAAVDRRAIEEIGVPGMVLMENAAVGVVDALGEVFPEAETVVVLCGPGNNGGDGLAVARHLDVRGYCVRAMLLVGSGTLAGDARHQLEILQRQGPAVEEMISEDDVDAVLAACAGADVVVDALFGTGLSRPLDGRFATLAAGIASGPTPVVAVDIPSGLNGSCGQPPGPHVVADLTVTFAAAKIAHVLPPACDAIGELVVADLGIAYHLVEEAPGDLYLITERYVRSQLTPRHPSSHKGDYGHAVVIGGSPGMSGAVVLATRAAVRSGAGLVTAIVPPSLLDAVDTGSLESMTWPRFETSGGDEILDFVADKDAVALGPGVGRDAQIADLVRDLVRRIGAPLVIDADGLHALAGHLELLRARAAPTVLTPHPGEAASLLGTSAAEVQQDRLHAARELARRTRAVVVLKGHRTLVAAPAGAEAADGEVWINPTGNSGMATGGTGDVLTGVVVALLARGWDAAAAATLAVYAHGAAGDQAAQELGETALAAGDVVRCLAATWSRLEGP